MSSHHLVAGVAAKPVAQLTPQRPNLEVADPPRRQPVKVETREHGHPPRARISKALPIPAVHGCPAFQKVVESEQCVGLATAKGCAQLDDTVARAAAEHFKDVGEETAKVPGRVGGPEELARVAVDLGDVGVAAVDAAEI